jgi:hypothetical protein
MGRTHFEVLDNEYIVRYEEKPYGEIIMQTNHREVKIIGADKLPDEEMLNFEEAINNKKVIKKIYTRDTAGPDLRIGFSDEFDDADIISIDGLCQDSLRLNIL